MIALATAKHTGKFLIVARVNKHESCIFCGESPCACTKSTKRSKATKKTNRAATSDTESKPPVTELPSPKPKRRFAREAAVAVQSQSDVDWNFVQAVQNLEPILAPSEKARYKHILQPPLSNDVERRLLEWRHRRESS